MPRAQRLRASARPKTASVRAAGEAVFELDVRPDGAEPILGAAYLMMDRAYALVSPGRKGFLRVTLRPKGARGRKELAELSRAFEDELAAQRLRWAVARNNRAVREHVAEHAAALAAEFAARSAAGASEPAADQLNDAQRAEIERLIAEVESEISEMNAREGRSAPAPASLSWEAARGKPPAEGGGGA